MTSRHQPPQVRVHHTPILLPSPNFLPRGPAHPPSHLNVPVCLAFCSCSSSSARFLHLHKQVDPRASPGGPGVRVCLPMQGTQGPPPVLERRAPTPWGDEDHSQQLLGLVPPLEGRPTCPGKDPACRNSDPLQPKINIKQTKHKQENDPFWCQKPGQRR